MIPKIIHLIWFGGKDIPKKYNKYIDTWKKYLPDYEIRLWNEQSFDVNRFSFTKEAYNARKWAFVSDFVRIYALYTYGGWYFDTDVEIVKSFNDFENNRVVLSTDRYGFLESAIMGAEPMHEYFKAMLIYYEKLQFKKEDGSFNMEVINTYMQEVLEPFGYVKINKLQSLRGDIIVYTDDYFHVFSLLSGKLYKTENTHSIHWHSLTWVSKRTLFIRFVRMKLLVPLLGEDTYIKLSKAIKIWMGK
ncbi:MAG: hypothetical protein PARBA_02783 [Parabacteroides sp.]